MSDKINDTEKIEDIEEKVENTTDNKADKIEKKSVFSTRNKILVGIIGALCVCILTVLGIYTEQKVSLKENYGGIPIMKAEQNTVRKNETFFENAKKSGSIELQTETTPYGDWVYMHINQDTLKEADLKIDSPENAYAVLEGSFKTMNISDNDLKDMSFTVNAKDTNDAQYRYDQNYKGVRILGGGFILTPEGLGTEHNLGVIVGDFMKLPTEVNTTPKIDLQTILKNENLTDTDVLSTELVIDYDTLVWLVELDDSFIEFSTETGEKLVVSEKGEHWGE